MDEPTQVAGSADEFGLGRIEEVDPRQVWKNEAGDLTPWVVKHLDLLAEALGIEIEPEERERRVGAFSLDILGRDGAGRAVIIENQLAATDHGHLGQLLVYGSGLDAAVVVWLTPSFRDEHRAALDWLNEKTDETVHFFGVELGLIRIGDSSPAPIFRVVARPNEWQKAVKGEAGISEIAQARHDFYEAAFDEMVAQRPTFRRPKSGYENWMNMMSGPFGTYGLSFDSANQIRAAAYIDMGDQTRNKQLFDELFADRMRLETEFGEVLVWERLDNRRASRIHIARPVPDFNDGSQVGEAKSWAAERLLRLHDVFDARLRSRAKELRAVGSSPDYQDDEPPVSGVERREDASLPSSLMQGSEEGHDGEPVSDG